MTTITNFASPSLLKEAKLVYEIFSYQLTDQSVNATVLLTIVVVAVFTIYTRV